MATPEHCAGAASERAFSECRGWVFVGAIGMSILLLS